jgi:hypothetical protein
MRKNISCWVWQCIPRIIATQEAEMGSIVIQGHLGQKVRIPHLNKQVGQ